MEAAGVNAAPMAAGRRLVVTVSCALAIAVSGVAAQPADGVDAAVQEFLTAFNSLDMPRFLACFADDAVMFHPPSPPPRTFPTRVQGRLEIERTFQVVFDQIRARAGRPGPPFQNLQPQDVLMQRFDGFAVVTFHLGSEKARGRRTLVFRQIGATWTIVHLHASTFDVAGGARD
jgi:ketosteroid isomerase-like protein